MKEKQTEQRTQVRFPQEVWDSMRRLALAHERSFNGEIIWALRDYIKQEEAKGKDGKDSDEGV